ncbi:hypothetical protein A1Y99_RS18320 [Acinetobacter baumannii]|uniref:hypothetical protein n=1 Tax=Acinetobacter baumannii TaxID=470 RepID=UPI000277BF45|nr:hypothetical protein [Acinetobacter baumannii]EJP56819.1 putative lipoprotein [Acinetobacter baumannii Naval-81]EHU1519840.1 hypothetical protein [Acinetobacter baumannii]EHU1624220.1 hypothetical protein [Acinetobacter baumannii]EHU1753756.1 hypothetical protein [Acinetobacter baumannii]EHU2010951.1 hypothetical protein [Acinetobacter baumannii]
MYKKLLKWFFIALLFLALISYSIVGCYIGIDQTLNVFFEDIQYNLLMLFSPALIVAFLLTRWEINRNNT